MLMVALRLVLFVVALVVPGGLLLLLFFGLRRRQRATPLSLDFEDSYRRVPNTRRGQHSPILVTGI